MDEPVLAARQIPAEEWPHGNARALALLPEEPADLLDLIFEADSDDLESIMISVIETTDGWRFGLLRYVNSPAQGTGVYVVTEEQRMPDALHALEEAFGFGRDHFLWIAPSALEQP